MKKNIMFLGLIMFIILIQIININIRANYVWRFIIFEFLTLIILVIFLLVFSLKKYKKLVNNFNNKNYDYIIKSKLIFFTKKDEEKHYFYYMKAMSYFEKENYDKFIFFVNKINHINLLLTKNYLKIIYFIIIGDDLQKKKYLVKYNEYCYNDDNLKKYYDTILYLIDKKDWYTEEEYKFINSITFEQIKKLINK